MISDDKTRDEKLQYDTNRQVQKISQYDTNRQLWKILLSPRKIDKYAYLTGEEILPSDQSRIIEQAKFTYSPLGKAFEKTNKNNWRWSRKTSKSSW